MKGILFRYRDRWLHGKNCLEPLNLILIVQQHNRYNPHRLFAKVALHAFSLQVLQKSIRKSVLRPLVPRFLLALRSAMRTGEFHNVSLRIAVQSSPTRSAYPHDFWNMPFHGFFSSLDPRPPD
jgi:hypothetical protein